MGPTAVPLALLCSILAVDVTTAAAAAAATAAAEHKHFANVRDGPWDAVSAVLADALSRKVFPGAVAVVGNAHGRLFTAAVGNYTDDGRDPPFRPPGSTSANPAPNLLSTKFDMASCTKVIATTSAVALLYQWGLVGLDDRVQDYLGSAYAAHGKGDITLRNCLLHNAGYPPDPSPEYWDPAFGCKGRCVLALSWGWYVRLSVVLPPPDRVCWLVVVMQSGVHC